MPQLLIVTCAMILDPCRSRGKTPPANTSCTTRRNGMIVMAVVVVCAIHDTMRASMSAAYVTRNIVTARSSVNIPVISPLSGKNIPHALKMIRVMTT